LNNDIKEILDYLKEQIEKETLNYEPDVELLKEEAQILLDYITNLQEEIERQSKAQVILDNQITEMYDYKSRNEKANWWLKEMLKQAKSEETKAIINGALELLNGGDE